MLGRWLQGLTSGAPKNRIAAGGERLAELCEKIVAESEVTCAGLAAGQGRFTLNYMHPAWRFKGISRAMLAHLDAALGASARTATLIAASAARDFYLVAGWQPDGARDRAVGWWATRWANR